MLLLLGPVLCLHPGCFCLAYNISECPVHLFGASGLISPNHLSSYIHMCTRTYIHKINLLTSCSKMLSRRNNGRRGLVIRRWLVPRPKTTTVSTNIPTSSNIYYVENYAGITIFYVLVTTYDHTNMYTRIIIYIHTIDAGYYSRCTWLLSAYINC